MPAMMHDFAADIESIGRIDAIPTILDVVCRTTGMGFAAVARVTEHRWIACQVRDDIDFGLTVGGELKVETTICDEIQHSRKAVVIDHVAESPTFANHPTPAIYGFQSYISVPIVRPDGRFFGTLCAIDPRPARLNTPEIIGMFTMFAQLIAFYLDADERLTQAEDVRRSDAFVKSILAASPDCVKVMSADGTLEFMNERGIELNQFDSTSDVLGKRYQSFWPESERGKVTDAIAAAAAGRPVRIEGSGPTAKGQLRWWEVSFAPLDVGPAGPRKIVGISRDISERVRATDMQRRSAEALQSLNESLEQRVEERTRERDQLWELSEDLLIVSDSRGGILKVSPSWTRLLGRTEKDLLNGRYADFLHPDDLQRAKDAVHHMRETKKPVTIEDRLLGVDGVWRWFSWKLSPDIGTDRMTGIGRDITIAREQQAALKDSEDFTRLALASVGGVGVWTYDVASDRFTCDAAIAELYGIDRIEGAAGIPRSGFLANVHPEDMPNLRAIMAGGIERDGDLEYEYRIRHPDGSTRWVLSRGHTYHDQTGKAVRRTGVGIETTRQRELEEQLRQSQKMEAVGQLTGGVAHDFNNLLTVIQSSIDLLKRPNLTEERRQRYIDAISATTTRATKLTGQLLAFARRQALRPEVFDVADSVRGIGDMVVTLTGSRIRIETRVPDDACFVNADASQFDTALVNMAVNARDAMEGVGTLTIVVGTVSKIPPLRAHVSIPGDFVTVSMMDTGAGIAAADVEKIFEPFFTTKGVGKGTGLGLSQVFGFVKQSGGDIEVRSAIGQGTCFILYLPRVTGESWTPRHADGERPFVDGHGTCVLVVEDNVDVGSFATQTLEELGFRPVLAHNAEAALNELAKDAGRFDVVFSDVIMPGMNGIDLAQVIRERHRDLPVVLTSGYSNVLAQNGPAGFELLHKPYSIDELSRVLTKAAHWRRMRRAIAM